ncbi:hypothetical protein C8R47DRAFT_1237447 [Mycena vitilis]|nr:hypothetical protein C8R47DRAFT_1237447 [Mycena vitilis]
MNTRSRTKVPTAAPPAPPAVVIPKRRAANKKTSAHTADADNPELTKKKSKKKTPDADVPNLFSRSASEVAREETRAALEKTGFAVPVASASASVQQPRRPKPRPRAPKGNTDMAAASAAQSDLATDTFNLSHRRLAKRAAPTEPSDARVVGGTVLAHDAPAIFTPDEQYLFSDRTVVAYDEEVDVEIGSASGNGEVAATVPARRPHIPIKDLKAILDNLHPVPTTSAPTSPRPISPAFTSLAPRRRCSSRSPTPAASHRSPSRGRSRTPRPGVGPSPSPKRPRSQSSPRSHSASPRPRAPLRSPPKPLSSSSSRSRSPGARSASPRPRAPLRSPRPRAPLRSPRKPLTLSPSRSPRSPGRSRTPPNGPRLRVRKPVVYDPPSPGAGSDAPPSSDEFGDQLRREERIKEKDLARGDQPRRSLEDEDEEDEEDFEREFARGGLDDDEGPGPSTRNKASKKKAAPGAKQKRASTTAEKGKGKETGKGKGKAKARGKPKAKKASPLADDEDDDGEGDGSESKSKPGPVSVEIRQRLAELNDKYEADVADIAREIGKPVALLHQILGDLIKTPRALSAWNVWQRWFAVSHPKDEQLESDSRGAFLKALHDADGFPDFDDTKPPTTEESFERLPWLLEWDRNLTEQAVLNFREEGKLKPKLRKELVPVLQIADKMRKTFDVQLWGFVIDPQGDASFMWGVGEDFKEMRAERKISLTQMCKQQEHIFGSINLRKQGLAPQPLPALEEEAAGGGKRDRYRKQLGMILGSQLWGFCKTNGTLTGHDVDQSKYQMKWTTKFADVAFENQVRLINYPAALKDAGQLIGTAGFNLKDITVPIFDTFMPDLLTANRIRDPEDMELDNEVMEIVRWTDEEMVLPLTDQREIPLVVGPDNAALVCVKSSNAYSHRGPRIDFSHAGKGGGSTVVPQVARHRSDKQQGAEREAPRRKKDDVRVVGSKRKAADDGEGDEREAKRAKRKEEEGRRRVREEQARDPAPQPLLKLTLTFSKARSFYATGLASVARSSRVDRATLLWCTATDAWIPLPDKFTPILAEEEDRGRYQRNIEDFSLHEYPM